MADITSVDLAGRVGENLEEASPDLPREMCQRKFRIVESRGRGRSCSPESTKIVQDVHPGGMSEDERPDAEVPERARTLLAVGPL